MIVLTNKVAVPYFKNQFVGLNVFLSVYKLSNSIIKMIEIIKVINNLLLPTDLVFNLGSEKCINNWMHGRK